MVFRHNYEAMVRADVDKLIFLSTAAVYGEPESIPLDMRTERAEAMNENGTKKKRQRGFMLLELVVVMGIIGVLAAIAVPKFTDTMTSARTARVQADLQVLNSAIVMRMAEKGAAPTALSDLSDYVNNIGELKPPSGTVYLKAGGTASGSAYTLSSDGTEALFDGHGVNEFGKQ